MKEIFINSTHRPEVRGGRLQGESSGGRSPIGLNADNRTLTQAAVCFGPSNDFVLHLIAERTDLSSKVRLLCYEDLNSKWSFSLEDGALKILTANEIIEPRILYVRGAVLEPDHPKWGEFCELFEMFNAWSGEVLCRPENQFFNESKLFQMTQSLAPAAAGNGQVRLPRSYVLKGPREKLQALLKKESSLIVKSLSGIRSHVVSEQEFAKWNLDALANLPCLFQERVWGSDVRLHLLAGRAWAIRVQSESEVDYRYDMTNLEMKPYDVSESLKSFCDRVATIENNQLIGFDFLLDANGKLYSLEANPGPGWAWYHRNEVCQEPFVAAFLNYLEAHR